MSDVRADFRQSLRPADVAHHRQQLLRWWSQPGKWQRIMALQGRRRLPDWAPASAQESEMARQWMAEGFRTAELYWVSPEMTDIIASLAPTIPDCLPQPPVPTAFVMFAKSVPGLDAETGSQIVTTGILWQPVTLPNGHHYGMETYAWRDLVSTYQGMSRDHQEIFREALPTRLFPTGGSEWPIDAMTSDFSRFNRLDNTPTMEASMLEDRRLMSTFWALVSQKIVLETRHQPSRAERRAAQREKRKLDDIRIIRLREAVRTPSGEGSVEYSHRWLVGEHWRRQWYPSAGEHRPKLIHSYVKGPADKPLVLRETVRALVR